MPLGAEVGLGPGHIVLDGTQLQPRKRAQKPPLGPLFAPSLNFRPRYIVAKRLYEPRCHLVRRSDLAQASLRWGPSSPPKKEAAEPLPNFRHMSVVAKELDGSRCHLVRSYSLGPGDIVLGGNPSSPRRGTAPNFRPMSVVTKRLD